MFLCIDDDERRFINLDTIEDLSVYPFTYTARTSDSENIQTFAVCVRFSSGKVERFHGEYAERIALELGMIDEASQIHAARDRAFATFG